MKLVRVVKCSEPSSCPMIWIQKCSKKGFILDVCWSFFGEQKNYWWWWIAIRKWSWNNKRPCFLKLSHIKAMGSQEKIASLVFEGLVLWCHGNLVCQDAYLQTMSFILWPNVDLPCISTLNVVKDKGHCLFGVFEGTIVSGIVIHDLWTNQDG